MTLSGNVGGDISIANGYVNITDLFIGLASNPQVFAYNNAAQSISWVADATLEYQKAFGRSTIKALAGYSGQQYNLVNNDASGTGSINNSLNQLSIKQPLTHRAPMLVPDYYPLLPE